MEDRETVSEERREGEQRSGDRWKGAGDREREKERGRDGERAMKERRNKGRSRFPSSLGLPPGVLLSPECSFVPWL